MPSSSTSTRSGRILVVIENVPLQRDSRVQRECRSLLAAGHEVTVVCPASAAQLDPSLGPVRLLTYPRRRDASRPLGYLAEYVYSLLATSVLVTWAVVRGWVDVVQTCSPPDALVLAVAPWRLFGKAVVFDHHDLSPELFEARFDRRGALHRVLLWVERAAVNLANRVICSNETIQKIIVERTGVNPDKVAVVRNGPLLRSIESKRPSMPELRHGRDRLCCWHGMMGIEDGVDLAVEAAAELVNDIGRQDCHFAFVGDGEARADAQRLAEERGITPWVSFPGWLSEDGVYDYLATADVGLSPDRSGNHLDWSTPIKVVEYMGFGVPVVGFQNHELEVTAGGAALVVGDNSPQLMAQAIDRLLGDEPLRSEMGASGRRRALEVLAWEHQAPRYLEVIGGLVAGSQEVAA